MKLSFLTLVCATILSVNGKSANEWKSRVVYQILTDRFATTGDANAQCSDLKDYCGGNFRGIIDKLDYIQGLGVNAILISPIPEQTDKGYHGYWQKNLNEINPHFGSSEDLKQLVSECHKRDVWVMLDVVANHMGNQPEGALSDFSNFIPFNNIEHYHEYCEIDWSSNDQHHLETCRAFNLPDLDQCNPFVRSTLKNWIHDTVAEYGFDGIRVDTVKQVPYEFWVEYCQSAGVYSIGEVFHDNPNYVAGYQEAFSALFNYPMYFKLKNAFTGERKMTNIHHGVEQNKAFRDPSVLGNFVDNHDNKRFLNDNNDITLLKNALAYVIFAEGIPFIYYGTEQGYSGGDDPANREILWPHYNTDSDLYKFISTLAKFRTKTGPRLYESKQIERYVNDDFFAFTRGEKGEVFVATSNIGGGRSLTRTIDYHPYPDGTTLVNVFDANDKLTVNGGKFEIKIQNGLPVIYTPAGEDIINSHQEL